MSAAPAPASLGARLRSRLGPGGVGALTGALVGVLVLGPALAPGFTLHYDLVHVPRLDLGPRTLGIDGAVPRAVPNDLVVALLSLVLPGWVVQKILLLGCFVVGGAGIGRLARTRVGAGVGTVVLLWNPWVGERLGIGHWGYLIGFAMLPWVLAAAGAARSPATSPGSLPRLGIAVGIAGLGGSTPGILAALLALVVLALPGSDASPGGRAKGLAVAAAVTLGVGASWWWPYLTASSRAADPAGVDAFRAAADTPLGDIGSLLLGGGLWNDQTWFAERQGLLAAGLAAAAIALLLAVALSRRSWWRDPVRRGATVAGVIGLVIAAAATIPGGTLVLTGVIEQVPGGGLLRDGQKFAALWVVVVALAATECADRARRRGLAPTVLIALALWPIATLPSLAWGHAGTWGSVAYPTSHLEVAEQLRSDDGAAAALPWSTYRRYQWNDDRVMLDPWNRLLPQEVITDDRLLLRDGAVAGEDERSSRIAAAVRAHGDRWDAGEGADASDLQDALRAEGVRWVIVDTSQPDPDHSAQGWPGPAIVAGDLRVYDLGAEPATSPSSETPSSETPSNRAPVGLILLGLTWLVLAVSATERWWGRGRRLPRGDG